MISRVKSFYLIDWSRLEILQEQTSLLWTKFQQFGNPSLLHKETCVIYLSMQQTSSPCLQTAQQTNFPFLIHHVSLTCINRIITFLQQGRFCQEKLMTNGNKGLLFQFSWLFHELMMIFCDDWWRSFHSVYLGENLTIPTLSGSVIALQDMSDTNFYSTIVTQ